MQALPGYAGRNEMTDGYERVQKSKALMKRVGQPRKEEEDPSKHFLSAEQYLVELVRVYERFNAEPQNGTRLDGLSPAEGWEQLSGGRPHHLVPESLRYLLATEKSEQKVTKEGVRLPGRPPRYFLNARLGELVGCRVDVRWNSELPGHVVVVDPDRDPYGQNPFVVQEYLPLPAADGTPDDLSAARRAGKDFTQTGRVLFRQLNHQYGRTVKDDLLGTFRHRLAGEALEEAVRGHQQEGELQKRAETKVRQIADRKGFDTSKIKNMRRAAQELSGIEELEAELIAEEHGNE